MVASWAGLSVTQVVDLHAGATYEVAAVGFLPGFANNKGIDARLVGPRRSEPRRRVPPCSVAVAGPYTGVYPFASPGGWNLIGTAVGLVPFSPGAGAVFAVGDTVRFVPVDRGSPVITIVEAAGLVLVQDGGRPGFMYQGVPPGGALVPELLARANRRCGNA